MVLKSKKINFLSETTYELFPHGLQIRERDMQGCRSQTIEYDRISSEQSYFVHSSMFARVCLFAFSALTIITLVSYLIWDFADPFAWVVWFIISVISYACFKVNKHEGIRLLNGLSDIFIRGKLAEINEFLNALNLKKIAHIRRKCSEMLFVSGPQSVLQYLYFLKENHVISLEQYESRKEEVISEAQRAGFEANYD